MSESFGQRLLRAWPLATLILLAIVFVLMLVFSRKAPVIASLEPSMAAPGQQIVVTGDYFGRTEREGSLTLAGEIPPPSLIQSWTDQRIVFTVPEDATSGLVTVSNSQGTSTGVLFTNTRSIPTVLQAASAPGIPLVVGLLPAQPTAGQTVTILGRDFGTGDPASRIRVRAAGGPVFEFGPGETSVWTDRSLSFRWPAGAGAGSSVEVTAGQGTTKAWAVDAVSPLRLDRPRTLTVEVRVTASGSGIAALWGPVPGPSSGTVWTLDSAQPQPLPGVRPPTFRWAPAAGGDRAAVYRMTLTSWTKNWDGFAAGPLPSGDVPQADDRPALWWKPAQTALRALTARWGLEVSDPWVRLQRLHTGLTAAFALAPGGFSPPTRAPEAALASGTLTGAEAASLGAALALQAGFPSRLVSGLWAGDSGLEARVWTEVWLAGAGWIPWDPTTSVPGTLDNRHLAFSAGPVPGPRLEPGARTFGSTAPWGQGEPAGEALWSDAEPVARWEIRQTEK